MKVLQENAQHMQQAQQPNAQAGAQQAQGGAAQQGGKDGPVDADFEVVDDEKKDENK